MKKEIFLSSVVAAAFTPAPFFAAERSEGDKPNVLLLVVDDWGARDLSLTGSAFYETPNVDRLCRQSTYFSNGYVAYPRSVPSRYALFTGLHCARPQYLTKHERDDRKVMRESPCMAEPFKASGYETMLIGKWHLAADDCMPQDKGFDINIGGGHAGATKSYFSPYDKELDGKSGNGKERPIEGMDDAQPGEYLTDYMGRKVVDYINREHDKPFFVACCFYAVHTPLQAKEADIEPFRQKRERLGLTDDSFRPEEAGEVKVQQNHPVYAGMIKSVDDAIGRMMEALEQRGLLDNTIVILISDHGGLSNRGNKREVATSNAPFKAGKGHLYEGGLRVPFAILLPDQQKGRVSDVPASSLDIFPTLVDLCGLTLDREYTFDGMSLRPELEGRRNDIADRKLYWHKADERPVSTGDYISSAMLWRNYKLLDFYLQNRVELYDVSKDPSESVNIASEHPEIVKRMMSDLNAWRTELNVHMATLDSPKHDELEQKARDNRAR